MSPTTKKKERKKKKTMLLTSKNIKYKSIKRNINDKRDQTCKSYSYHKANEKNPALHTFALELSDIKYFISEVNMLLKPFVDNWFLKSTQDLSTNKAALCLSSVVREIDFSIASQGHIFIAPPSEPDHKSPESRNKENSKKKNEGKKKDQYITSIN